MDCLTRFRATNILRRRHSRGITTSILVGASPSWPALERFPKGHQRPPAGFFSLRPRLPLFVLPDNEIRAVHFVRLHEGEHRRVKNIERNLTKWELMWLLVGVQFSATSKNRHLSSAMFVFATGISTVALTPGSSGLGSFALTKYPTTY